LAQETFLRVYTSIHSYTSGRAFRPWIYTIARNLAWKRLRERRGQAWISMEDLPETGDLLPDTRESPETLFYRTAHRDAIHKAVEGLPEEQSLVFLLYHYQSLSYEEIAEVCNCPIGTVKSRMHYALAHLRRRLAHLREER
jgi:RNA polymerase sigma-70 factor (ECF subfamily)